MAAKTAKDDSDQYMLTLEKCNMQILCYRYYYCKMRAGLLLAISNNILFCLY